jgi:hypothetical protein
VTCYRWSAHRRALNSIKMYKSTPQIEVCLLVISVLALSSNCSQPVLTTERTITVGLVYCDPAELLKAQQVIAQLNIPVEDPTSPKPSRLKLELKSLRLNKNENTISLSLLVCGTLISNSSVYAVIVGRTSCLHKTGDDNSEHILTLSAISFTCAYYQIPVIDLYSRESDFSDKVSDLLTDFNRKKIFNYCFWLKEYLQLVHSHVPAVFSPGLDLDWVDQKVQIQVGQLDTQCWEWGKDVGFQVQLFSRSARYKCKLCLDFCLKLKCFIIESMI